MISVYKIKPAFQRLLHPLVNGLRKSGVTPNRLTIFGIVISAGLGAGFWFHPWGFMFWLIPAGLLLRMMVNALDGMMARQFSLQSKAGEMLNEFGDVISDILIYFPLVKLPNVKWYLIVLFVIGTVVNEFAGLLAKVISGERRYDGPMGKSDRAMFVGVLCLVYYFWPPVCGWVNEIMVVALVLIGLSTLLRLRKCLK